MSQNFAYPPQDFETDGKPDWTQEFKSETSIIYDSYRNKVNPTLTQPQNTQKNDLTERILNETSIKFGNKTRISQKKAQPKGKRILRGNVPLKSIRSHENVGTRNHAITQTTRYTARPISEKANPMTDVKKRPSTAQFTNDVKVSRNHTVTRAMYATTNKARTLKGNAALKIGKSMQSTNVALNRPLQIENYMPQRSTVLKHPIDHCYDTQQLIQNPEMKCNWTTYCPHHTSIHEEKLYQRKGTYIYILDKIKSKLTITEMWPVPKDVIIRAVSGKYHTFWFLRDDTNAIYATSLSSASVGQLGLGYNIKHASFEIPQMLHFKSDGEAHEEPLKIACGEMHSIFATQNGKNVFAAGSNLRGACGLGTSRCVYEATPLSLPKGYIVRHVAAGDAHTVIIARNEDMFDMYDEIFVMGAARSGALGLAGVDVRSSSQTEPSGYTESTIFSKYNGRNDTESVTETASNWETDTEHRSDYAQQGNNDAHSISRSNTTSQMEPLIDTYRDKQGFTPKKSDLYEEAPSNHSEFWVRQPQKLYAPQLRNKSFKGVYCNAHNTLLVTKNGEIYGMGSNESGSLGIGHDQAVFDPRVIFRCTNVNSEIITHVACGEAHTVIVTDFRKIFVTGSNKLYQLGLHHNIDIHTFTRMDHQILESRVISLVRCGRHVTVIVTADNCVFCFGGRFGEFNESRYLKMTSKTDQILDVTIENDTPMLILGKKKKMYI